MEDEPGDNHEGERTLSETEIERYGIPKSKVEEIQMLLLSYEDRRMRLMTSVHGVAAGM